MANPLKMLKLKPAHFQLIQEVKIDAPPRRAWAALLDMGGWFRFDPTDAKRGRGSGRNVRGEKNQHVVPRDR